MTTRSIRNRLVDNTNLWPGFVDVLATLLIVIIFVLMIFTVSQIYLSDAISGRDKILSDLKKQINELSKILIIETREKDEAISSLSTTKEVLGQTEEELQSKQLLAEQLQTDVSKKRSEIFVQEQNILALSEQITELLTELRIVANALKTYEGIEVSIIETEGLGQRINKALATRIDQLKELNNELDLTNKKLQTSEENLAGKVLQLNTLNNKLIVNEKELENKIDQLDEKNKNLQAINKSLGLDDASLVEQLQAISNKNENLSILNEEILASKKEIEEININLTLRDKELQDQILKYQNLTTNLLELNESLGLQDADIKQQLLAIRKKNKELSDLNKGLLDKDKTIFDLRGKILELNNILSLSEDEAIEQTATISNLQKKISDLNTLNEIDKEQASLSIKEMELQSIQAFEQVASLSGEIDILKNEINILNKALESSEQEALTKDLKIEVLGERLNKALTSKVFELQKYRSEFFGKLQKILGQREDIKIVGDRFIFESELLFDSASADLQINGKEKLKEIGMTLKETTNQIPKDIDWIIQVEGHTDKRPIKTAKYPSNWELSTARANSVLKLLLELGFSPNKLSAAGYGEFYPISDGENEQDYQQNRRIELRLTSR
tara:strand:- start:10406 stop:12256 length:1851 start_codon:yes stop_codon:yes gene_type:complete